MVGPLDYVPATPTPEHGPHAIARTPAPVREAPPGFRLAPGALVEARVLGVDRHGHLMLRTDSGILTLATRQRPPTGRLAVLQFYTFGGMMQAYILRIKDEGAGEESDADPDAAAEERQHPALHAGHSASGHLEGTHVEGMHVEGMAALTRVWPAMEETLARLATATGAPAMGASTSAVRARLAARLPHPGPGLTSSLMFALRALAHGDLAGWLGGDVLSALHRHGGDAVSHGDELATRLHADLMHLHDLTQPDAAGWQLFVLPLLLGETVRSLRFFLHAPPAETAGTAPDRPPPRRFVVELDLPHLGEVQLDGLLTAERLDMILRSRAPLAESLQARLDAIAADGRQMAGREGSLSFVANATWTPLPVPGTGPWDAEAPHGLVV